jgi:ABC-2 type transport system permease protein
LDEKGVTNLVINAAEIFSGGVVPIPFFPSIMQKIANILPFRYVSDLSFRIYTNNVSLQEGIKGLLIQAMWFIIIFIIGNILLKKSLKKVVVQGG